MAVLVTPAAVIDELPYWNGDDTNCCCMWVAILVMISPIIAGIVVKVAEFL